MIVLVVFSAFFSMSETAFSSTTDAKLRLLIEERKSGAKKALQLASNFDKTLITLLIGNNIVNVLLSTLAVLFFGYLIQDNDTLLSVVSTAVVTITILIFGEILPKVIAKQYPEAIAVKVAWPVYVIMLILTPLVYFFLGIQKLFTRRQNESETIDEDELGVLIDQMEDQGEIEHDEAETIRNVFDLNDRSVSDIMIPRIQMDAINYESTLEEVKSFMIDNPYSRIPVYKTDKDHIIGILYERDFFPALIKNPKMSWRRVIKPAKFVAGSMKVDALIEELQKAKTHIAIVSGEYGDVLGLVTLEDAIEEIVGEIYDEHDIPGDNDLIFLEEEDGAYIVDGEWFVDDLFDKLGVGDQPDDVPSKLSGWMFAKCESIPKPGFSFDYVAIYTKQNEEEEYEDFAKVITFTIDQVKNRRIETVKVTIRDANDEEIEAHNKRMEEEK
ncbi:MAG: HlyC/CorC family transporter [Acholeplasmatales bacterium]|nr:HlyC/CorC family transporter [Acholeplasmatales bacterium]